MNATATNMSDDPSKAIAQWADRETSPKVRLALLRLLVALDEEGRASSPARTPVMLFGHLTADHQAATDFTWDRGVLIFAYDPRRIDAETALFVAGFVARGPVYDLDAVDPADLDESAAGTAPPETADGE